MKQWYEALFENYAKQYDNEVFTQGTLGECDFIENEIDSNKSRKILDIGCGTGRHSIELSKRGYDVLGVDLSDAQLARAREKASEEGLSVTFEQQDARKLPFEEQFDLAIMLCEGGFSLMETDEMNFQILQGAANALKPKGKFIFTCLNALFPLFHSVEEFMASEHQEGTASYGTNSFDMTTFRESTRISFEDDDGEKKELECNERYYAPSEITWLLKSLHFNKVDIFGAKLGAYSRNDTLTTKDFELLVIAEKA